MSRVEDKLVTFSPQYLRLGEALPFGVRDASGNLLLAAGQVIETQDRLDHLASQPLTANDEESADWRRRLTSVVDSMLRQNVSLKEIAGARPSGDGGTARAATVQRPLDEQWEDLIAQLDTLLRETREDKTWLARVEELLVRSERVVGRKPDASLYYMIWRAGHSTQRYCAQHGLLTALVLAAVAPLLGVSEAEARRLGQAALTMNVAMVRLQDQLATSDLPLSAAIRQQIHEHAPRGAAFVREAGAEPALARIVALHHSAMTPPDEDPRVALSAQLLRRVDIFTAKLSRRKTRPPQSPVQAARQACLGADGKPDAIGGAVLKGLGLYPPGSFVALASGERGIVIGRGKGPSHPEVASLVGVSGMAMTDPILRDTADARWQVKAALTAADVRVIPIHAKVMALI